ncbi:MAG: TonB-dependent receptor plug domain-containing protein, partial [Cruoricaptor ignavus]|nr:TonB-dependent receptor plug domain-containing protein [Cruoricaptor ignavus]
MKNINVGILFLLGCSFANAQMNYENEGVDFDTIKRSKQIEEVELFGELKKQPRKMEIITRMPLKPRDQIQSISIISEKAIADMGALNITDAAKNIPGVVLFSNYGGGAESMSIRGYRGTPVIKNGVLMNSDFRTSSMIADMQGIESIQIIRGSAAITQGFGNALGAAGGVINLVTKTPRFHNITNVGFRYGSWDLFRGTVDFQRVLDANERIAVRFNAAYQNNHSFTDYVKGERIYVNPSVAIRPDDKTSIILEMDYMHDERTPNRGTVNLAADNIYAIYDLPKNKFLGFSTDKVTTNAMNFGATVERKLNDFFKFRAAYMASDNNSESIAAGRLTTVGRNPSNYAIRNRSLGISGSEDHSKVFQFDFVGQEVKTGIFKHTFQVGFDWKESYTRTNQYRYNGTASITNLGQINVLEEVSNILPSNIDINAFSKTGSVGNPKT